MIGFNQDATNTKLGAIVLVLGIIGLARAYTIWTRKTFAIKLARTINIIIIVYATGQESYTIMTATAANTVIGSLNGTATALGLLLGVVLNLPTKNQYYSLT